MLSVQANNDCVSSAVRACTYVELTCVAMTLSIGRAFSGDGQEP